MTATADDGRATALRSGRARILAAGRDALPAAALRDALCELYEMELARLAEEAGVDPGSGFALVAFGGLGRREVLPHSDLDLVLVMIGRLVRQSGQALPVHLVCWSARGLRLLDEGFDVIILLIVLDAQVGFDFIHFQDHSASPESGSVTGVVVSSAAGAAAIRPAILVVGIRPFS